MLITANKGSFVASGMGLPVTPVPSASFTAWMLFLGLVKSSTLGRKSRGGAFENDERCTFLFLRKISAFSFNLEVIPVCLSPTKGLIPNQVASSRVSSLTSSASWLPARARPQPRLCWRLLWAAPREPPLCLVPFPRVGARRLCFVHPRGAVCQRAHHGAHRPAVRAPRPLQQGKPTSFCCCTSPLAPP